MKIILYNNNAERSKVDKTLLLTNPLTFNGTLREECSITNPVIEFRHVGLITSNYAYIEEFNRYYFIDEIVSTINNLWRISMTVDVLMSFKDKILQLPAIISRQENSFNELLKDDLLPLKLSREFSFIPSVLNYNSFFKGNDSGKEQHCFALSVFAGTPSTYTPVDGTTPVGGSPFNATLSHSPYNVCCQIYAMTYEQVQNFISEISGFDFGSILFGEKGEYIVSLRVYPFDLKDGNFPDDKILINKRYMKTLGYELLPKTVCKGDDNVMNEMFIDYIKWGSETANRFINNKFLLYSPYTECKLYLPYIGLVNFDPKILNRSFNGHNYDSIGIYLMVDYISGQAAYNIYPIYFDNQPHKLSLLPAYTFNFNLGSDVPISFNREATIKNNLILSSIKTAINIGGAVAGVPLNSEIAQTSNSKRLDRPSKKAKRMGELSATESALGSLNIATNYIDSITQAMDYVSVNNNTDGYINAGLCYFPCIYLNTPVPNEPENYAKLYGRPSMKYEILGDLNGFTIVSNVHIENIPTATSTELDEIEMQLKSGVIF